MGARVKWREKKKLPHTGILFISPHYVCFHAKTLGLTTKRVIPFATVTRLEMSPDGDIVLATEGDRVPVHLRAVKSEPQMEIFNLMTTMMQSAIKIPAGSLKVSM